MICQDTHLRSGWPLRPLPVNLCGCNHATKKLVQKLIESYVFLALTLDTCSWACEPPKLESP